MRVIKINPSKATNVGKLPKCYTCKKVQALGNQVVFCRIEDGRKIQLINKYECLSYESV